MVPSRSKTAIPGPWAIPALSVSTTCQDVVGDQDRQPRNVDEEERGDDQPEKDDIGEEGGLLIEALGFLRDRVCLHADVQVPDEEEREERYRQQELDAVLDQEDAKEER